MVSEINESLRWQKCAYPNRYCEFCPHSDKAEREGHKTIEKITPNGVSKYAR